MNEKDLVLDSNGAAPCKICRRKNIISYPTYFKVDNLVYARCTNCEKYSPYEFVGANKKGAVNHWNLVMQSRDTDTSTNTDE